MRVAPAFDAGTLADGMDTDFAGDLAAGLDGAFAAPAAAFAQASNVQIFGTMYMEYAYAKQGVGAPAPAVGATNDQVNVDILQNPGSEIGIRGREKEPSPHGRDG